MPRRLLYIAFHFPPVRGSSGIQRTLKFVTYLRDHDWESIVLTVAPRAYEQVSNDQMAEIPPDMEVHRAFGLNTAKHLAIRGRFVGSMAQPDRWVTWWPAAVWRGLQVIRRQRPAAIVSTSPIPTAHLIGLTLARISGLPWIADCRDSLTEPGYPRDGLTWRTNRWLESAIVKHSTRVVFTTEGTLRMYVERYPAAPPSRWAVIENGFDEENFRDAERDLLAPSPPRRQQLTLLHSGVLYPQERDPRAFFEALRRLKASNQISCDSLRVVLRATGNDEHYRVQLAEYGIDDIVVLALPTSYRAALQEMLVVDGLLLFQGSICNHQIPAKLYEYFRAGRPMLTLTDPAGNTADAVRAAGSNHVVDLVDPADIAAGLVKFLEGIRAGTTKGVSPEVARRNSRRARSSELAEMLDSFITSR
jgi:hypothetical protein